MLYPKEEKLPKNWVWKTIGDITEPIIKVNPEEKSDREFTYFDISSIDNNINRVVDPKRYLGKDAPSRARQLVYSNDVLFSTVRTYLKNIALVPNGYDGQIASTGFSILRGKPGVLSKYLFYYSLTEDFLQNLSKLQRGTSYPAVRDSDVRNQKIPLPPTIGEQEIIVAKIEELLSDLDSGVSALKRVRANLTRYKASVLKAACEGRLVPTEAELARQEGRDYESGADLLQRILAARRKQWEASQRAKGKDPSKLKYEEPQAPQIAGLPDLPEGWVWTTVEQVADHRLGKMLDKQKNHGELHPYLRNANVRWFGFDLKNLLYMRVEDDELDEITAREGDLIICEGGEPGRAAVWGKKESIVIQKALHRVRLPKEINPWYIAYFLALSANNGYLEKYFTGSTIKHFTGESLRSLVLPLPPFNEQNRLVEIIDTRFTIIAKQEQLVSDLLTRSDRLRQSILKQAFEGRLINPQTNLTPPSAASSMPDHSQPEDI